MTEMREGRYCSAAHLHLWLGNANVMSNYIKDIFILLSLPSWRLSF